MRFDLIRFHSLLRTSAIGVSLEYEHVVGSTMDVARGAGHAGAPHGHTVLADEQTAGRGRFGRRWVAPPGVNLTFTVIVRPTLAALERLSMVAALAVADGARETAGVQAVFKWPNDVLVEHRKLAGILIEAEFAGDRPAFALVGIGLNVNMEPAADPEVAEIAVSLRDLTGRELSREVVLAAVLGRFERWYGQAAEPAVLEAWSSRLVTLGREISVAFRGEVETGIAESVSDTGALRLRRADGSLVELTAGEVTTRT